MIQDRSEGRLVIDPERECERYKAHKPERIERAREIVLDDGGEVIALEVLIISLASTAFGTSPNGPRATRRDARTDLNPSKRVRFSLSYHTWPCSIET
jgi:hypothetical protein